MRADFVGKLFSQAQLHFVVSFCARSELPEEREKGEIFWNANLSAPVSKLYEMKIKMETKRKTSSAAPVYSPRMSLIGSVSSFRHAAKVRRITSE